MTNDYAGTRCTTSNSSLMWVSAPFKNKYLMTTCSSIVFSFTKSRESTHLNGCQTRISRSKWLKSWCVAINVCTNAKRTNKSLLRHIRHLHVEVGNFSVYVCKKKIKCNTCIQNEIIIKTLKKEFLESFECVKKCKRICWGKILKTKRKKKNNEWMVSLTSEEFSRVLKFVQFQRTPTITHKIEKIVNASN